MGPSGSGKSTLAFCLAGLCPDYVGGLAGRKQFGRLCPGKARVVG